MAERAAYDLQGILQSATVKKAVDDVNREMAERRAFQPPLCSVFAHPYYVLDDTDAYRFTVDREAERQLPHIIGNKVQIVRGRNRVGQEVQERYTRRRNIGIVFSGGPAPGGHNVIAGLFDAAKRANPDNRLFGFLVGPEGGLSRDEVALAREVGFISVSLGKQILKVETAAAAILSIIQYEKGIFSQAAGSGGK